MITEELITTIYIYIYIYIYILMRFQIKVVFQRSKQPSVVTTNFDDVLGDICAGMLYSR